MSSSVRRVAHLDMDAFFASVELLRYPELRGQPVVIGGRSVHQPVRRADGSHTFARLRDYAGRGVVTTSTYEARAFGVFSAMGLMKAAQLAPDAYLLPADFDAYRHYSQLFKQAVAGVVGDIEDRGIDEIYIELDADAEAAGRQAVLIKRAVNEATGLSCSIGVAPNKLLAKICSDLDKPDGLTILMAEDIPRRIWPLAVRKVNGIGPKADAKLAALGIHTIAELARAEAELLQTHFGRSYAAWLREVAHGVDERALVTSSEPKSISRETTFERDLHARQDRAALTEIFTALCVRVAQDLSGKGYLARTIGIKLRFADFSTVTRDVTLPEATADAAAVRAAAGDCLRRVPLAQRVRLLGVRASALCTPDAAAPARPWAQGELCFGA
ncbi:DNA polymerase IV [Janthinobacterium sp.]|uniref:DNA polymerase IV n=1 Tax=Janthinobacterium sp. TaxID=1871054 RepID=UPI00293D9C51|nr:DNA polymerase IV [Janthinobacterium sp.]